MSWFTDIISFITTLFGGSSGGSSLPKKIKSYGMVNNWMKHPDFNGWMKAMSNYGCNCVWIELMGKNEENWQTKQSIIDSKFESLVAAARKYGIWVFVNIGNRNSPSLVSLPNSWFTERLAKIKKLGPKFIIVQAWSEWGDGKADAQCNEALNTLPEFKHSYNRGSRPNPATTNSKYAIVDWHIVSMTDIGPDDSRLLSTTDTTNVLNQMQTGGVLGQTFKSAELKTVATNVLKSNRKGFAAYGFNHNNVDLNAVKIIGAI